MNKHKTIELSDEQFIEQFKPLPNPFDEDAPHDGCALETYGKEFDYVKKAFENNPDTVWTIVDYEGYLSITDGLHYVNRMGYIITEFPADPNCNYDIMDEQERKEMMTFDPDAEDDFDEANDLDGLSL